MAKLKSKKSLEFLTIMTTVIGTMIGAGIYVKNDNGLGHVLGETQNPYTALIGWLLIGIVVISAMMVFLEVASATAEHGNGTVSNWARLFTSRRFASAVSIYYVFTYLPVNYAFFSTLIISYVMTAAKVSITNPNILLAIYLCFGLMFIAFFGWMNTFQRLAGKKVEIVGTFIKFIPLILVLLAIFIPDTQKGVFFNGNPNPVPNQDAGGRTWDTSLESITGMRMFSGFTPIMFAFNGFIYAANMQKETEHKEVVSTGILTGLIITTIFYILISVSLFLGSKDGSVVSFFEYMFSGFKKGEASDSVKSLATLFSNIILALVCVMGLNSYTLTGANFYNTDANEGIIFSNNKFISQRKSGTIQAIIGAVVYVILIVLALYTGYIGDPNVVAGSKGTPGYYMDIAGNGGAILGFTAYTSIIIGAMINRKTNRVKVKKMNNWVFWICGIFSSAALVIVLAFAYLNFFGAFGGIGGDSDIPSVIAMGVQLVIIFVLWVINEIIMWFKPFDKRSIMKQEQAYIKARKAKVAKAKGIDKVTDEVIEDIEGIDDPSLDMTEPQSFKVLSYVFIILAALLLIGTVVCAGLQTSIYWTIGLAIGAVILFIVGGIFYSIEISNQSRKKEKAREK